MDLATIDMQPDAARKAFLEYRRAVQDGGSAEDEQIMLGYRELAKGRTLIRLSETIHDGGVDEMGLPRLAVMQANATWCWVRRRASGSVTFQHLRDVDGRHRRGVYSFPEDTLPSVDGPGWRKEWTGNYRAMVPLIPPGLRPPYKLGNYAILWEATWAPVPGPPGDPALLRHIGGDLYAVLAIWDLTELERAVLAGRSSTLP